MEEIIFSAINIPLLLIFLCVFVSCYLYMRNRVNLPPGPPGLPIVGNTIWLSQLRKKGIKQHLALCEASKKYGDVISLTVVSQRFVFLQGYDTIRDAFVKNADVLSDRPSWLKGLQEATKEGKGVIWQSGSEWKIMRKFVIQTLRDFGVGKTSLEEKIMQEVEEATAFLINTDSKPTDIRLLTSMMITNVIYGIVFAKRFDYDDEQLNTIIENLDTLFKGGGSFGPEAMIPSFLLKLLHKKGYEVREARKQVIRWIKEHIYNQISQHENAFDNENIRDFIDLYLQAKNQQSDEKVFNKGNIFRVIMDLFIAGSETTSNTINWCILYMQEYPEIQKKCQEEISKVTRKHCHWNERQAQMYELFTENPQKFGNKVITWADRASLPYVEATLLEIQRMANIAPFSVPHTNEVDTAFKGYFIPRRTLIVANLYSSNMDPLHWTQPEVFIPERFIEGGNLKKIPALIPFSIGPRICLGESLAKMEMFLIFTNLLQRFTFCREDDNVKHSFECIVDQFTSAPVPYKTRAVKRT